MIDAYSAVMGWALPFDASRTEELGLKADNDVGIEVSTFRKTTVGLFASRKLDLVAAFAHRYAQRVAMSFRHLDPDLTALN